MLGVARRTWRIAPAHAWRLGGRASARIPRRTVTPPKVVCALDALARRCSSYAHHADFRPGRFEDENHKKGCDGVVARLAEEGDVDQVAEIFRQSYKDYPYKTFFETTWLKSAVFSPSVMFVVAEDTATGKVVGTSSIMLDYSSQSDLCGEFGRLAVHPDERGRGIGNILMDYRVELAEQHLYIAVVENRAIHSRSQAVSAKADFACVGFLPQKFLLSKPPRESVSLWVRHFGHALALRDAAATRIIPEAAKVARLALANCSLPTDIAIDDSSPAYTLSDDSDMYVEDLTARKLPFTVFRLERGRVNNREIFGPAQLDVGFAKLEATHAHYVTALEPPRHADEEPLVCGAVGYVHSAVEHKMRVFELVSVDNIATRLVLETLVNERAVELGVEYIEVDVSAASPSMQRTLLELGFIVAAFVPSLAFTGTKRVDVVKMVKLLSPLDLGEMSLIDQTRPMVQLVRKQLQAQPQHELLSASVRDAALFQGTNHEQHVQLAAAATIRTYNAGERVFHIGDPADSMYLILDGECQVFGPPTPHQPFGVPLLSLGPGQLLSERTFLNETPHNGVAVACGANAQAKDRIKHGKPVLQVAEFTRDRMDSLMRRRPDIGLLVYKNLARDLGAKLHQANLRAHS